MEIKTETVWSFKAFGDTDIAVVWFKDPRSYNDKLSYWNTGFEMVGHLCTRYPKAAKKQRVLKKWIRRHQALWGKTDSYEIHLK